MSKALAKIADVLPQVNIAAELYHSDDMRDAISRVYEQIMRFLLQALKWYDKGRIGRALSVIISPYELEYKDIVEQIEQCTSTIRHLAMLKSQAEIRDLNTSIAIMRQDQLKLSERVDTVIKIAEC